jgi:hypothetical protein
MHQKAAAAPGAGLFILVCVGCERYCTCFMLLKMLLHGFRRINLQGGPRHMHTPVARAGTRVKAAAALLAGLLLCNLHTSAAAAASFWLPLQSHVQQPYASLPILLSFFCFVCRAVALMLLQRPLTVPCATVRGSSL